MRFEKIQIKFGDVVNRIASPSSVKDMTLAKLQSSVCQAFPEKTSENVKIVWMNDKGERTVVHNDEEIREAIKVMMKVMHRKIPRFRVVPLRGASSSDAPTKANPTMLKKFSGPFTGELKDYAYTSDGRFAFDTFEEAAAAAMKCRKCRGITQEAISGKFTLRLRKLLKPASVEGNKTWIMEGQDVRMRPTREKFPINRNGAGINGVTNKAILKKDHVSSQIVRGPMAGYLGGDVLTVKGCDKFSSLSEAALAALHCKKCHGITMDDCGHFVLSSGREFIPSMNGEVTWIMKRKGIYTRPSMNDAFINDSSVVNTTLPTPNTYCIRVQGQTLPVDAMKDAQSDTTLDKDTGDCTSMPSEHGSAELTDDIDGPYEGYLSQYAFTKQRTYSFATLDEAVIAARNAPKCRGITREASGVYTLRKNRNLKPPVSGEVTWVIRTADVNLRRAQRTNL